MYALFQNYPNPFNPTTLISYALPRSGSVTLKIYDMLGREVKTLVNAEQNSGVNTVQWNGDNNSGSRVSSGTYIYMIKAGEFTQAKKMILLK
ncbi:MAG: T9SS type A sorting domain-containing protein [Ignavibacteriales bacterium]|nr:T9SS type A sorting domain-containing protein [Ignavibacteriales bacterium]